jgi:hypothetical protein
VKAHSELPAHLPSGAFGFVERTGAYQRSDFLLPDFGLLAGVCPQASFFSPRDLARLKRSYPPKM